MNTRVCHVITGLGTGGAERMLLKLVSRMNPEEFHNEIISLTGIDSLAGSFEEIGVPVRFLGMSRGIPDPRAVLRLARFLRRARPQVVQTWMYHSDVLGGLAAKLAGSPPVIWNIRNGTLLPGASSRQTILLVRIAARLSHRVPERIVCCAESAREIHRQQGYESSRMVTIANGFDLERFKPDPLARQALRRELGIADDTPLIGLVARFDAQKRQEDFLRAGQILSSRRKKVRYLLCGDGIGWENDRLAQWIREAGLGDAVLLLGRRTDVHRIDAALDIACSASSYGEGFSNSIGEAMACGVPCVVTDVGDSGRIVGDTGVIVPPNDPEALAEGWEKLLALGPQGRQGLGGRARQRMRDHFSLERAVEQYEALYREVGRPSTPRVVMVPH